MLAGLALFDPSARISARDGTGPSRILPEADAIVRDYAIFDGLYWRNCALTRVGRVFHD